MVRLLCATAETLSVPAAERAAMDFESGTNDIPDAYRAMLVKSAHLRFNAVMVKEPLGADTPGRIWFCVMSAMLFGLSSSVVQFGRWSRFLEAFTQRIMWTLWMLSVDDSCMVDLKAGKGTAQRVGKSVFAALGIPLAEPKSQRMGTHTDFLGITHDL